MSRRPASLLVLLALLATLWQPLCPCRGALAESRDAANCCSSEDSAPLPSSPCEEHGGDCECGHGARLVPLEPASPVGVSPALLFELPSFAAGPALAARAAQAEFRGRQGAAEPGRPRALPLRI